MSRTAFYHSTIKKIIVAFGTLFDELTFEQNGTVRKVPVHYAPKEKFISYITERPDQHETRIQQVLPRMAFELTAINFAPERYVNPLGRVMRKPKTKEHTWARVPYDFQFSVYIATKQMEDSLKIVEQILPFFTPELNITIHDLEQLEQITDIPVVLNGTDYSIEYEGAYEESRRIEWTLTFTAKAWLYSDIRGPEIIKKTIVDFRDDDFQRRYVRLMDEVIPKEAEHYEEHTIRETIDGTVVSEVDVNKPGGGGDCIQDCPSIEDVYHELTFEEIDQLLVEAGVF